MSLNNFCSASSPSGFSASNSFEISLKEGREKGSNNRIQENLRKGLIVNKNNNNEVKKEGFKEYRKQRM